MKKKNNKNPMLFWSIECISLLLLILFFIIVDLSNVMMIIIPAIIICFLAVLSLIFGFKAVKESKKQSMFYFGIFLDFLIVIITIFFTFTAMVSHNVLTKGEKLCTEDTVSHCVDNNDGTSTCRYMGYHKITCKKNDLKENQYR